MKLAVVLDRVDQANPLIQLGATHDVSHSGWFPLLDHLQDSKLVNVFHLNSRVLIVQLPYSSIDEVVGDDFQAYIRDAVQCQCQDDDDGWTTNVGRRRKGPPHDQTVREETDGSRDVTAGFWDHPAEPVPTGYGSLSSLQDGESEAWDDDDEHEEVRHLEEMGDEFWEPDVVFVEERVGEDGFWHSLDVSEYDFGAEQGLEDDFELALRLHEEEVSVAGGSRVDSWDGRGTQAAGGSQSGQGSQLSGAALLEALQKQGGGLSGGDVPSDPGAKLLAAIRSGSSKASSRRVKPAEDFPPLSSHNQLAAPPKTLERREHRSSLVQSDKCTDNAKKPYLGDTEDFAGLTMLSRLQGFLVDNLKFSERQAVLDHTDRVLQGPASSGVSADRMKAMMAKSAKDAGKLSHSERLLRDGPSRDLFSRKSMEKLKHDMVAAGWLNIRHATHLVYRREMPVPSCCGAHAPLVQRVVVACTPSSPFAIKKVFHAVFSAEVELHDKLQEMKRVEDARLAEAAAKGPTQEQEE